jgi:hypothetical protein
MHRRTLVRNAFYVALLASFSGAGCSDVKDLLAFNSALQAQYGTPADITLSGTHLTITFENAPKSMLRADSAGSSSVARDVAIFAKRRYPKASQLEDVTVAFATVTDFGPIRLTRRDPPHTFRLHELP